MSGYKTHYMVAAGCGATLLLIMHQEAHILSLFSIQNFLCILSSLLGGLFPDIDIKSKGQQLLYALIIPLLIAALLAKKIVFSVLLGALGVLSPLLPHRGITHELWFVLTAPLLGPLLVSLYCPEYTEYARSLYLFFIVGAVSHLVLDFGPQELITRTIKSFLKKPYKTKKK
ncbi:MAG: metal-dependent hydrolase [bacterium]